MATSVLLLGLAACGDGDGGTSAEAFLDGSPRPADAEGRLVDVADDFSTITLDGERVYEVDEDLLAFSAADGTVQPLLRWENQYVQVGLDGETVEWLGGISAVVDLPEAPVVAYFTDVLTEIDGAQAVFRSGTVLDLAEGLEPPTDLPAGVVATIDVEARRVVAIEPG